MFFLLFRYLLRNGPTSNIGSNTLDQRKEPQAVNGAWDVENEFSTVGPYETHRDKANIKGVSYYVPQKPLSSTYSLPTNNRLLLFLFLPSFLLYFCFVFDEN